MCCFYKKLLHFDLIDNKYGLILKQNGARFKLYRDSHGSEEIKVRSLRQVQYYPFKIAIVESNAENNFVVSGMIPIKRRKLPHIYRKGAIFFITFRLFDSLPQNILRELKSENQERFNSFSGYESRSRLTQINFKRYEDQLDGAKHGNCVLSNVSVAKILAKKIMQYDNVYYELINYCIMPNHVHLLVDTQKYSESSKVESSDTKAENVSKWMKLIKGG